MFYMAHISDITTYKDAQEARIIITPALAPGTRVAYRLQ